MKCAKKILLGATLLAAAWTVGNNVYAQAPSTPPGTTTPPAGTAPAQGQKQPEMTPLTLDSAPPVNAEEDAALKTYMEAPLSDIPKKLLLGEDFLKKYPQSRYRSQVLSWQVQGYVHTGQLDKMQEAGEKELELVPNDAQTMATLGSVLPRSMPSSMTPEQRTQVLSDAEGYSKKALELVPTLSKPAGVTDEQFVTAKNQIQALAYSGLGLVAFRRNKYAEAIPNLEQSVKYDPNPDPVNYFVLGISNEKASHFDDAITAFTKCAAIQSSLVPTCKNGIEEAKKLAATQLSVPK